MADLFYHPRSRAQAARAAQQAQPPRARDAAFATPITIPSAQLPAPIPGSESPATPQGSMAPPNVFILSFL
ncbi:hypothetical protein BOTBODRAFT_29780 [Botryobasidium botryosum FD-172 SS1]|uniref:Uncharacterized protein n=1 Tax=Botryobasidium botryosum (strain FD-172 SS1) TaxID=930990 RepID=A0A067MPB3_BOTB1|nr:hypothetical protein BOTBODRAFT_29780 [Botryobasidium botryosum FD-172 SS1]